MVDGRDQQLRAVRQRQRLMVQRTSTGLCHETGDDDFRPAPEASPTLLTMQGGCTASVGGTESIFQPLPRTVRHVSSTGQILKASEER